MTHVLHIHFLHMQSSVSGQNDLSPFSQVALYVTSFGFLSALCFVAFVNETFISMEFFVTFLLCHYN